MKTPTQLPYIPDSGETDQKFDFFWKDTFSKYFASEEESINSLDKLLKKRTRIR